MMVSMFGALVWAVLSGTAAGTEFGGGVTMVVQGSSGAPDDTGAASASIDFEVEHPLSKSLALYLHVEAGPGTGLDVGTLSGINEDADGDASLRITEFNLKWGADRFELLCGMLDASAVLDANAFAGDETGQFLASAFVHNPAVEFPDNAFGLALVLKAGKGFTFRLCGCEADADWQDSFDRPFGAVEVEYALGEKGTVRLCGWVNGEERATHDGSGSRMPSGVGLSADLKAGQAGLFVRVGMSDGEVCETDLSGSLGLVWRAKTWPEGDALGFAVGVSRRSDEFVESNPGTPDAAEIQIELFYRRRASERFALLPDLQLVLNPDGDEDADPIVVFGLRSQVSF
ncbi:hypothetical protein ES703_89161 [subsurface metagenome]